MTNPKPPRGGSGSPHETSRWTATLYDELRALARRFMRSERMDHTLEPTALVHEAFVRMRDGAPVAWRDRAHFLAVAAKQMRRVLVDHARARGAKKRGGGGVRISLAESVAVERPVDIDVIALNEAIERLAGLSPRQGRKTGRNVEAAVLERLPSNRSGGAGQRRRRPDAFAYRPSGASPSGPCGSRPPLDVRSGVDRHISPAGAAGAGGRSEFQVSRM